MSSTDVGLISMGFPASVLLGGQTAKMVAVGVIPGRGRCRQRARLLMGPMDRWVGWCRFRAGPQKGPTDEQPWSLRLHGKGTAGGEGGAREPQDLGLQGRRACDGSGFYCRYSGESTGWPDGAAMTGLLTWVHATTKGHRTSRLAHNPWQLHARKDVKRSGAAFI